jgi:hypothetical protein
VIARALGPIVRAPATAWCAELALLPAVAALLATVDAAPDDLGAADALVTGWVGAAFAAARADEPAALATALLACATHALARYLVATPSLAAGALRTVAAEALQACTPHRAHLRDRDVENALAALAPAITTAEPTLADHWLAYAERRLGLDARWHGRGDRGGALADRLVGPEQLAALSWHLAALLRARPAAWAAQVAPIAARLAWLTGATGAAAWAEAAVALHATGALDRAAAIDALASAHFLIHGHDGTAAVALARMHLEDGHGALALACLCEGLGAGGDDWRAAQSSAAPAGSRRSTCRSTSPRPRARCSPRCRRARPPRASGSGAGASPSIPRTRRPTATWAWRSRCRARSPTRWRTWSGPRPIRRPRSWRARCTRAAACPRR